MIVLVTDKLDEAAITALRDRDLTVMCVYDGSSDELREALSQTHGWIVRSGTQITSELLAAASQLKVIGRAGVGVDNIDVAAATKRGVAVVNTPMGNTIAAVEHTMALLLSLARHVPVAHDSLVNKHRWDRGRFTGVELYGKSIGIIGLGKIGSRVAARARAFGMTVLGYDPYLSQERADDIGIELCADLGDMLGRCDFLSLHMPVTETTAGLVDAKMIARMKPGIRLVNCARGNLIDEAALAAALQSGHVAGAAVDVFQHEPPLDSPLLTAPNVVATPHLGASTEESQRQVGLQVAEQVADALQHGVYREAVNIPVKDWATLQKLKPQLAMVECLGTVAQQYVGGGISQVQVEYLGGPFEEIPALNNTLLKGMLVPVLGESVNAVNAPVLAAERGIELAHTESSRSKDYNSLVRIRVVSDGRERTLSATTFADLQPRLVELDGHDVELFLEGILLLFMNVDRPGVIGDVGQVLGQHDINIAHFSLGRKARGGEALAVVVVDEPIPTMVIQQLAGLKNMQWVKQIVLNSGSLNEQS